MQSLLLPEKAELLGSFLLFTQVFYKIRTGRDFVISQPQGRESHHVTIAKALTDCFLGIAPKKDLLINVPPRYGKTELLIHFIAWALARFPDSQYLYISYGFELAQKQTKTIKEIVSLPLYRRLFDVHLKREVSAGHNFETTAGGSVYAAGATGPITGRGAGIKNCHRWGGCVVWDDIHKPDEVASDTMRERINNWYDGTLSSRINSPATTPILGIGQRLHEDDLPAKIIKRGDATTIIIPAIDAAGNALDPKMHSIDMLNKMATEMPYEFAAQYQQNPQPAGGGIFKPEWFQLLDEEPQILATLITADTAETSKDYNDASVFSFWGVYKIKEFGVDVDLIGLHWINCIEIRVEPKELESEFRQFYADCLRHPVPPKIAAIEKKSTGTTLLSLLDNFRGLNIINIERTKVSGSKSTRYLEMQRWVAAKHISLPRNAIHTPMCIEHMRKITANDSHRFDDICDTAYDAVKMVFIGNAQSILIPQYDVTDEIVKDLASHSRMGAHLARRASYGR